MNILLSILGLLQVIIPGPTITTSLGKIHGTARTHSDVYLGIPYAQPPVGDLAFRAPVPVEAWDTVLDATHAQGNCIQEDSRFSANFRTRDCLYLNVYVPHHMRGKRLPVMVWIHGGSFATGGTGADTDSTLRHDMGYLAEQMQAIVVTINYRLNVFGYLYLSELSNRFDANCGLRDQLLALQWVKKHIGNFGGDPQNITLFGQSAGAASVMAIMSIPQANPLYNRVIVMSPVVESFLTREEATERAHMYLKLLNIPARKVEQLVDESDEQIQKANKQFMLRVLMQSDMRCAFSPVIDGELLTQMPAEGALQCRKPMLIGYVSHESELFGQGIPAFLLPFMARIIHVDVPTSLDKNDVFAERFFYELSRQMFFVPIEYFYTSYLGPKERYCFDFCTPQMQAQGVHCCHSLELPIICGWSTPLCDPTDSATLEAGKAMRNRWKMFIKAKK